MNACAIDGSRGLITGGMIDPPSSTAAFLELDHEDGRTKDRDEMISLAQREVHV